MGRSLSSRIRYSASHPALGGVQISGFIITAVRISLRISRSSRDLQRAGTAANGMKTVIYSGRHRASLQTKTPDNKKPFRRAA
jgi:hypothetical protein